MVSEDAPRNVNSETPPGPKNQPASDDSNNPQIPPNATPIYNQKPAADDQSNNAGQEPNWRRRFRYIRDHFPRADFWLALFTGILVIETYMTISVLRTTDDALHESARASHDSAKAASDANKLNVAGLRPWVTLGIDIAGPLTIDNRGAHLPLNATVHNLGRSPAQSVLMGMRMVPKGGPDALLERDKICDQLRKSEGFPWSVDSGFLLFPGRGSSGIRVIHMSAEDLSAWRQNPGQPPAVVGCIEYLDAILREIHRTRFAAELDRKEGANAFLLINPNETSIPAANLNLNNNPFMPWSAD